MIKLINWIDRSFDFNFSPEIFPAVVERLRGTPVRLEEISLRLPEELLTKKINNKWSIKEHAGHLLDLEELNEKRLQEYKNGMKILSGADISNKKTSEKNYNSESMKNIISGFRERRDAFAGKLEDLDLNEIKKTAIHPRLNKEMRLSDFAYFIAEHDDHHLAKIREIINLDK